MSEKGPIDVFVFEGPRSHLKESDAMKTPNKMAQLPALLPVTPFAIPATPKRIDQRGQSPSSLGGQNDPNFFSTSANGFMTPVPNNAILGSLFKPDGTPQSGSAKGPGSGSGGRKTTRSSPQFHDQEGSPLTRSPQFPDQYVFGLAETEGIADLYGGFGDHHN